MLINNLKIRYYDVKVKKLSHKKSKDQTIENILVILQVRIQMIFEIHKM